MKKLFVLLFLLVGLPLQANVYPENDLKLPDLENKIHKLSDYQGKWVLVNYWATWCPPCRDEIPDLVEFHDEHKDKDAVVLGVNLEYADKNTLELFKEEFSINYPILHSAPSSPGIVGTILALPTTYLVDPEGKIVAQQSGPVTKQMIESFIKDYKKG